MAKKKKTSKARKAAPKSRVTAKPAKKTMKKAAAANRKTKSTVKSVAKKSAAPAQQKSATAKTKPAAKESVRHPVSTLTCAWDVREIRVTGWPDGGTHFHYVRTNPEDCEVRIRYQGTLGGPIDNTINAPGDTGQADCSGQPQDWDALETILRGNLVTIQLFQGGIPKTPVCNAHVQ